MKKARKKAASAVSERRRLAEVLTAAALLLALVLSAIALRATEAERELTSAQKRIYAVAKVTDVMQEDAEAQDWTEGRRLGTQYLEVKILSGDYRGQYLDGINYLSAYSNVDCREGVRVIVRLDLDESGQPYVVSVPNYDRGIVVLGLVGIFVLLLVLIGGRKGAMAVLGLAYTVACIWFLLIPLILRGVQPIPATIAIVAITTAASLILLTGFSKKTLCAVLGCVGGVAAAGLFAAVTGHISPLNGFNMSEAEELVLRASDSKLHISGLFVSGILIASLGAVMDVAMSISSACNELHEHSPLLTAGELYRSGMNIGRDAMGTMANTLILAFAGASLNVLVLFQVYGYPLIQIANSDSIVIELVRGITGSIGILLTVPLVSALSAWMLTRNKHK